MIYLSTLYESFRRVFGWPSSIFGIALCLLGFFYVPAASVLWKYVIIVGVVVLILLAVLIDSFVRLAYRSNYPLPRVLRALPAPADAQGGTALLLLEPSELFGQQALVSVFCLTEDFEVLIALAETITIQRDRKIQIMVRWIVGPKDDAFWRSVLSNDSKVLQRLIVKPSTPANFQQLMKDL